MRLYRIYSRNISSQNLKWLDNSGTRKQNREYENEGRRNAEFGEAVLNKPRSPHGPKQKQEPADDHYHKHDNLDNASVMIDGGAQGDIDALGLRPEDGPGTPRPG